MGVVERERERERERENGLLESVEEKKNDN